MTENGTERNADSLSRLRAMREMAREPDTQGACLVGLLGSERGWQEYLTVLARDPALSPLDAASLARYRLAHGVGPSETLITPERAAELGGALRPGAQGVSALLPTAALDADGRRHADGFAARTLFAPSMFDGIDRDRPVPPAASVAAPPVSLDAIDLLISAASSARPRAVDPISDYIFSLRYGLVRPGEEMPAIPPTGDIGALMARLSEVVSRACAICDQVDRDRAAQAPPQGVAPTAGPSPRTGTTRRPIPRASARPDARAMTTASLRRALADLTPRGK